MRQRGSGYRTAVLASFLLHGGIIALLISGWHPEFKPRQMPQATYMEAALLQVEAPPAGRRQPQKAKPAPPKPDPPKPDPAEAQRQQQAAREKAAAAQAAKEQAAAKAAQQKAAAEKAVQEKVAREKIAKEKAAKEKNAKEKAVADKAAKDKAAKDKAAKDKAAKEKAAREKAAQEKAAQEKAAQAKAAAEQAARDKAAAEQAAARGQRVATYESYVRDRIAGNWNRPPSARRDMQVELQVRLVPTGQVMGVAVIRSSGDPAFDQSAVNAVQQVGRFERLQELSRQDPLLFEQNFRTLNLTFRPDDLRL